MDFMTTISEPRVPLSPPALPKRSRLTELDSPLERRPDAARPGLQPEVGETAMTIAMVSESESRWGMAEVVACLASLAATDELVVIVEPDPGGCGPGAHSVAAGLQNLLPRHTVVSLYVTPRGRPLGRDANQLDDLLEMGSLPIVCTPAGTASGVGAALYELLHADRMLRVSYSLTDGADPLETWQHRAVVCNLQPPRDGLAQACRAA